MKKIVKLIIRKLSWSMAFNELPVPVQLAKKCNRSDSLPSAKINFADSEFHKTKYYEVFMPQKPISKIFNIIDAEEYNEEDI